MHAMIYALNGWIGLLLIASVCLEQAAAQDAQPEKLPDVTVTGQALQEELPVGPYRQPEWTTERRFPNVRAYVLPPWQIEIEQWLRGKFPRDGGDNYLFQEEIGIGLPHRFQFDLYENWVITDDGSVRQSGVQVEGRWALADWGEIPLNPTLYAEWKFNNDAPDVYELKLLFAETIVPRWHWALNLVYEQEVGGGRETVWEATQGVSYTVIDEKFSVGSEMKLKFTSVEGSRSDPEWAFLLGPSIQWLPTRRTHLDIAPLFGLTGESLRVDAFIVFGIEFGPGGPSATAQAPVSSRSQ